MLFLFIFFVALALWKEDEIANRLELWCRAAVDEHPAAPRKELSAAMARRAIARAEVGSSPAVAAGSSAVSYGSGQPLWSAERPPMDCTLTG